MHTISLNKVFLCTIGFIISLSLSFDLFSQQSTAVFDGKIVIGDDLSTPVEGAIRFNDASKLFEGFNGTDWVSLSMTNDPSASCTCPYVVVPFTDQISSSFDFGIGGVLEFSLEFSHKIDIASIMYGTNVSIAGDQGTSTNGQLIWSDNRTKVRIRTSENWSSISSCGSVFTLTLIGTGNTPILGAGGLPIDGDRDGCCNGDYVITFRMRC